MREAAQVGALRDVLRARTREAETRLREAREALASAEHEHAVCLACVREVEGKLATLRAYLASPGVADDARRYAGSLDARETLARDLERERFVLERAADERRTAREALADRRAALARLRSRDEALRERLGALARERVRDLDRREEDETDELAALGRAGKEAYARG